MIIKMGKRHRRTVHWAVQFIGMISARKISEIHPPKSLVVDGD
jgi:hypothetical protein